MLKIFILSIFTLLSLNTLHAQQAYRGGTGDGYAMHSSQEVFLSVKNDRQYLQISLSPNPVHSGGTLYFKRVEGIGKALQLSLLDLSGRVIKHMVCPANTKEGSFRLPLLAGGIYMLRVESPDRQEVQKVVVY